MAARVSEAFPTTAPANHHTAEVVWKESPALSAPRTRRRADVLPRARVLARARPARIRHPAGGPQQSPLPFLSLQDMAAHRSPNCGSFRGDSPRLLAGYCFSGSLAYEVAAPARREPRQPTRVSGADGARPRTSVTRGRGREPSWSDSSCTISSRVDSARGRARAGSWHKWKGLVNEKSVSVRGSCSCEHAARGTSASSLPSECAKEAILDAHRGCRTPSVLPPRHPVQGCRQNSQRADASREHFRRCTARSGRSADRGSRNPARRDCAGPLRSGSSAGGLETSAARAVESLVRRIRSRRAWAKNASPFRISPPTSFWPPLSRFGDLVTSRRPPTETAPPRILGERRTGGDESRARRSRVRGRRASASAGGGRRTSVSCANIQLATSPSFLVLRPSPCIRPPSSTSPPPEKAGAPPHGRHFLVPLSLPTASAPRRIEERREATR